MSYSEAVTRTLDDDSDEWVPYFGPDGGEGMQNTRTGEVDYSRDPTGFTEPQQTEQVGLPGMDYEEDGDSSNEDGEFMETHMTGLTNKRKVTDVDGDSYYVGTKDEYADNPTHVVFKRSADGDVERIGDRNDFLRRHEADKVYEAEFGNYAEEFNREFWENPPETLYHTTKIDSLFPEEGGRAGVILGGLRTSNKTRGLRNTGVGSAVFTSERPLDAYGQVRIEVDVQGMAEDGYTPEVSKEPPWARVAKERRLIELFGFRGSAGGDTGSTNEDTRIFYGDIPVEYLEYSIATGGYNFAVNDEDDIREELQERYDEWKVTDAAQNMELEERRRLETVLRDLGVKVGDEEAGAQLADGGEWVRYRGPRGGEGWQNTVTGDRVYQKDKPGTSGDGGAGGSAVNRNEFRDYEQGDEQFMDVGDVVTFKEDGEVLEGTIKRWSPQRDLVAVEVPGGETHTVETWAIETHRPTQDDLSETRDVLREAAENAGIGTHSTALNDYTDDQQYRTFQQALRSAEDIAKGSPVYEDAPRMETASAALLSVDERTADTIKNIQHQARADLPEEITVYRGIDVDDESFLDRAESAMQNGNPISDPGFQSTTINDEVAESFGNVTLQIETDHGAYVRAASDFAGEDEVLLPAGQQFEVDSVDRDAGVVEVTAVGGGLPMGGDLSYLRELMERDGLTYGEAVSEVV